MKENRYAVRPVTKVQPPVEWGKVICFSDYVERERRRPRVTWERSPVALPRWLETLSNWVEGISTAVMTGCAVYWMWYCMCCL